MLHTFPRQVRDVPFHVNLEMSDQVDDDQHTHDQENDSENSKTKHQRISSQNPSVLAVELSSHQSRRDQFFLIKFLFVLALIGLARSSNRSRMRS